MALTSLWDIASQDVEREQHDQGMTQAMLMTANLRPFLYQAASEQDLENRLALSSDRIEAAASHTGVDAEEVRDTFRREVSLLREAAAAKVAERPVSGFIYQPWEKIPNDYKGEVDGQRSVLHLTDRGTSSVPWRGPDHPEANSGVDPYKTAAKTAKAAQPSRPSKLAELKRALQEGVNPLEWLPQAPTAPQVAEGQPSESGLQAFEEGRYVGDENRQQDPITTSSNRKVALRMPAEGEEVTHEAHGIPFTVTYHSEQAMGDNGLPARGYTTGAYTVVGPDGNPQSFYHTPHGPGLSGARDYAADQARNHMMRVWSGAARMRDAQGQPPKA